VAGVQRHRSKGNRTPAVCQAIIRNKFLAWVGPHDDWPSRCVLNRGIAKTTLEPAGMCLTRQSLKTFHRACFGSKPAPLYESAMFFAIAEKQPAACRECYASLMKTCQKCKRLTNYAPGGVCWTCNNKPEKRLAMMFHEHNGRSGFGPAEVREEPRAIRLQITQRLRDALTESELAELFAE
jgi:hypothetical protein